MSIEITEESGAEESKKQIQEETPNQAELIQMMRKELDELKKSKNTGNSGNDDSTAEAIKQLVEGLKEKSDDEKYGGQDAYINVEDIDKDDYIDDGVTFFSHRVMFVIVDDKRNGHAVQTPFKNKIVFAYQSTKKVGTGKESKLHNLSAYTSHSTKEIAWLEEHTCYGSLFFKSHMNAMTVDAMKASKLARAMGIISRLDTGKVIKMAVDMGIEQSEDIQMLRIAIANKQVDAQILKENSSNELRLKESIIEKEVIPIKQL